MLEYLRNRLCRDLVQANVDPANHYCEMSRVIAAGICTADTPQSKIEELIVHLQHVSVWGAADADAGGLEVVGGKVEDVVVHSIAAS